MKPWAALFNSALWPEATHMILAAFIVARLPRRDAARVDAAARPRHAVPPRRARAAAHGRDGRRALQIVAGDWAARHVAAKQPTKLAAIEGVTHTETGAPLHIGGIYIDGTVKGAIRIPDLLSLLAYDDPHATVQGLDAVAPRIGRR